MMLAMIFPLVRGFVSSNKGILQYLERSVKVTLYLFPFFLGQSQEAFQGVGAFPSGLPLALRHALAGRNLAVHGDDGALIGNGQLGQPLGLFAVLLFFLWRHGGILWESLFNEQRRGLSRLPFTGTSGQFFKESNIPRSA
jgi:hypothetical protein